MSKLYPFAGTNIDLTLQSSQMSIEEFYEETHEGVEYSIEPDSTVEVNSDQLDIEDVEKCIN